MLLCLKLVFVVVITVAGGVSILYIVFVNMLLVLIFEVSVVNVFMY